MDTLSPKPPLQPRPEAVVLSLDALTEQQTAALQRASGLLAEMARAAIAQRGRASPQSHHHASANNQVILIDGGRGAGKTTLLLTLLDQLRLRPSSRVPALGQHRYTPLRMLDLNPIPDGMSILSHIAAHLAPPPQTRKAPWRSPESQNKHREAWRRFAAQIPVAQGHAGPGRAARDPEVVIYEMEQAAASWSTLTGCFYDLIDAWLEAESEPAAHDHRPGTSPTEPLLVFPIDDADLQIERGIEVLTALRMLSHPSLVFLLTGDSRFFQSLLRHAMFARLRRSQGGGNGDGRYANEQPLQDEGNRLAYEFFERVLPPDHRCAIASISPLDRLRVLNAPTPASSSPDLLRDVPLTGGSGVSANVASLLEDSELFCLALPDRLRALINLHRMLVKDLAARADDLGALWVARRIWRDAVRHEPMSMSAQHALLELFGVTREGNLEFRGRGLTLNYAYVEDHLGNTLDHHWVLRRPRSVRGWVDAPTSGSERIALAPGVAAALQITHDVAALTRRISSLDNDAIAHHNFPSVAVAYLFTSDSEEPVEVRLPLPRVRFFRGVQQWVDEALAILKTLSPGTRISCDEGARAMITAYLWRIDAAFRGGEDVPGEGSSLRTWREIMGALALVIDRARERFKPVETYDIAATASQIREANVIAAWVLDELILLAAPEYGLERGAARELLTEFLQAFAKNLAGQTSVAQYVRERAAAVRREVLWRALNRHNAKRRNAAPMLGSSGESSTRTSLEKLLERADDLGGAGHPWQNPELGPTEENIARSADAALAVLGSAPLKELTPSLAPPMPSLATYIERISARQRLLQEGLDAILPVLEARVQRLKSAPPGPMPEADPEQIAAEVWKQLSKQNYITAPKPNRLKISSLPTFTEEVLWDLSLTQHAHLEVVRAEVNPPKQLTPAADLAYRVILDLANDGHLRLPGGARPILPTVPGPRSHWQNLVFTWPTFPFATPFDAELFHETWEELVQATRIQSESQTGLSPAEVVDLLVLVYIRLMRDVVCSRLPATRTPDLLKLSKAPATPWREALLGLYAENARRPTEHLNLRFQGMRRAAFVTWRDSLFMFAAPEYGLSYASCRVILDILREGGSTSIGLPAPSRVVQERNRVLRDTHMAPAFTLTDPRALTRPRHPPPEFPADHPWFVFEREFGSG